MRDELETRPTPSKELEPGQLDDNLRHLVYSWLQVAQRGQTPSYTIPQSKLKSICLETRGHAGDRPNRHSA